MHLSFMLRVLLGHGLLSMLRTSVTVIGAGGFTRAPPGPPRPAGVVDDGVQEEEIHAGAPFRSQLGGDGFVSEWNRDWFSMVGGGRSGQGKCINIPDNMTLCRGIGYDHMRLPNLLDHDSVREAVQQAASWIPLMNVRCHRDTQVFLCSLFAPVCLDRPIWPCETLCKAVKAGCESRMSKYGFPWPEMLRCDKFPSDNDLCVGIRQENQSDESSCPACVQPETFEIIVDNFCSADYAMKIRLHEVRVTGSDLKLIVGKKKKVFKSGDLTSKALRDATFYIENGAQCNCRITEELKSNPKKAGSFLIIGNHKNERLVLSFIKKIEKSTNMTKAMDAIRRGKICKAGLQMITSEDKKKSNGKGKPDKTRDNNKSDTKRTDTKAEKQEEGKTRIGKKDDAGKHDRKKNGKKEQMAKNGNKADDVAKNTKNAEATKGSAKKERRKTENNKRSTINEQSGAHKTEKRSRHKEPKHV